MPSRVVRGDINSSQSLSGVSLEANLTFRALITAVDDYGRFDARPEILKGILFPLQASVTPAKILRWVRELDADGCVQLYWGEDGRPYLHLTGWERHRGTGKRGGKSRYPEPPACSVDPRGKSGDPSENRESGSEKRETLDESARGKPGADAPAKAPRVVRQKTPAPDDLDTEQKQALLDWVRTPATRGGLDRADLVGRLRPLVSACLDHHRAKGNLHADWVATCRTWIRNEAEGRFTGARGQPERVLMRVPETFAPTREPGVDYEAEREEIKRMIAEKGVQ
jgi:hypothetical protein